MAPRRAGDIAEFWADPTKAANGLGWQARRDVRTIYRRDFDIETKADESPLTEADMASHHALVALLHLQTPDIPVLSEGAGEIPYETRRGWARYWLIDPLDGTEEFIKKSGEFTLNVALIEQGVPVFGIVHAPVLGTTWWGLEGEGAWKQTNGEDPQTIQVRQLPDPGQEPWKVVGSRSHGVAEFEAFCADLPKNERVSSIHGQLSQAVPGR